MARTGRPRSQPAHCTVDGCDRGAYAKTYCRLHYLRWFRTGTTGEAEPRQRAICVVGDCGQPHASKGYCTKHYRRFLKYGDPLADVPFSTGMRQTASSAHGNRKYVEGATCSVEGCDRKPKGKGLCAGHYQRKRNTGDVGASDFGRYGTGRSIDGNGYVVLKWGPYGDQKRLEHRVVMEQVLGRPLRNFENVHHRNGQRADNRPENLELWIKPQPCGQRLQDMIDWMVEFYPAELRMALEAQQP